MAEVSQAWLERVKRAQGSVFRTAGIRTLLSIQMRILGLEDLTSGRAQLFYELVLV